MRICEFAYVFFLFFVERYLLSAVKSRFFAMSTVHDVFHFHFNFHFYFHFDFHFHFHFLFDTEVRREFANSPMFSHAIGYQASRWAFIIPMQFSLFCITSIHFHFLFHLQFYFQFRFQFWFHFSVSFQFHFPSQFHFHFYCLLVVYAGMTPLAPRNQN